MGTDIHYVFQKQTPAGWEDVPSVYEGDRHYLLFAWLAEVREGVGSARVPTHSRIEPIAKPRGLPCGFDVDEDGWHRLGPAILVEKWHDVPSIWMGDHSLSWLLGDEILNADRPQIVRTGIIEKKQYESWDGVSEPDTYSVEVSGPAVKINFPHNITPETTHVLIRWTEDTSETLEYFVAEVRRLKELHGKIRMVFGFDS